MFGQQQQENGNGKYMTCISGMVTCMRASAEAKKTQKAKQHARAHVGGSHVRQTETCARLLCVCCSPLSHACTFWLVMPSLLAPIERVLSVGLVVSVCMRVSTSCCHIDMCGHAAVWLVVCVAVGVHASHYTADSCPTQSCTDVMCDACVTRHVSCAHLIRIHV